MSAAAARTTHSTAAERRKRHGWRQAFEAQRLLPLGVALLIALAGALFVHAARSAPFGGIGRALARGEVRDLNRVRDAAEIERLLEPAFDSPGDRAYAARRILETLPGGGGRAIANVGALAAIRVAAEPLAKRRDLDRLRERATVATGRAQGDRSARPVEAPTIALLTAEQLRAIKPGFVVRTPGAFQGAFLLHLLLLIVALALAHVAVHARGRRGEPLLLPAAAILVSLGFVMLASLRDPVRDQMLFARFAQGVLYGAIAFVAASRVVYERSVLRRLSLVPLAGALLLAALLVVLGQGPSGSDAKVNLFGIQPVEVIRLLLVLFLAGWFAERWQLIRELDEPPLGSAPWLRMLKLPRLRHALPVAIGVAAAIAFFFLQRDLGPALILAGLFLSLYAVSRGGVTLALFGLAAIVAAFAIGYAFGFPATVTIRTGMWLAPWENGLARGDQLAHALWAFGAGGFSGTGLGLGLPSLVPAAHTDLILAAVGEELGFVGVLAVLALDALLIALGFRIARRAPDPYTLFLALGLTVGLALQTLWITGGVLGLVPLSGVVTPFLSYGRSALILHFAGLGMLWSISASGAEMDAVPSAAASPDPRAFAAAFAVPVRVLATLIAMLGGAVLLKAAWVQVANADGVVGRGSLALQADGELRYQYNPRLIAVGEMVPRGDIYDRNGVLLATSRWAALEKQRDRLRALGVDLERACTKSDQRHYPLGGLTYHLIGDAISHRNWGASNTAYLERLHDGFLSGYDDHARSITITDPGSHQRRRVVRRDLSGLVPLWRHRREPNHPAVKAFLARSRDVRSTIDVQLQAATMRLLRDRLSSAGLARGAVVVLDAERGDVLASASWPAPEGALRGRDRAALDPAADTAPPDEGILFDRARFGLYPPGSTFKLITAAAALARDPALASAAFECRDAPGGRAGALVNGRWVRDDETDRPHGTLTLEQATVVSCNAYYAQLARRIGWSQLESTAQKFELSLGDPPRAERDAHLIASAYGQGRVLATPYRMARVAAAIANHGRLPAERWTVAPSDSGPAVAATSPATSATLARYMRGVVERGTAARLAGVQPAIAGKTGTAEVANEPSHSWFVGYAPHGAGERKIAFAVMIENGGYGAARAAPLAAEVVGVARDLGFTR